MREERRELAKIEQEERRELARVEQAEIGEVYNGMIGLKVTFHYEEGMHQGLGAYVLDAAFVIRFMAAVGVYELKHAVGKSCWVTHTHDRILKIEPLHKKDGRPFVVAEWVEWVKKRMVGVSYRELETGV